MKLLLPIVTLAAASVAHSAIVAQYDFASVTDPNESTETFISSSVDTDTNSLASDVTSPSTHNSGAVNPEFGDIDNHGSSQGIGWSTRGNNPDQTFAIVNPIDTYVSFNVAAQGGATLDFSSLSVLTGIFATLGNTTANDYTLSYSTDGTNFTTGATILAGTNSGEAATVSGGGTDTATISFDLSGITALQGVTGTASFRLDPVASSGSAENGTSSQRAGFIDDVIVNADVTVVPEPATTLLGALGLLAMLRRRR